MAWVRFRKKDMPGGLWTKCQSCGEMIFTKELLENFKICKKCAFHMNATVDERVLFTCDADSFEELYTELAPVDRLQFIDKGSYADKLKATAKKAGRLEGMTIGYGRVLGRECVLGVMNFQFLGGSMGVVVGEKVTIAVEMALERKVPLVLVCSSGGARMHEGALSLMQMAKTCAALARFADAGGLYVSILTDPTTGGVTASFATMADVILAEPNALIGFAGPRVIQNTIRQELPEGFQRSEFLLSRGQLDRIVRRDEIPQTLFRLFEYLVPVAPEQIVAPTRPRFESSSNGHDAADKSAKAAKDKSGSRLSTEDGAEASKDEKKKKRK